jgi:hypothetical protein
MRKMTCAAIAIAAVVAVGTWSAPSVAQSAMWNGPVQQNGKCWKRQGPEGMGFWQDCPKPTAAAVPARQTPGRARRS